MNELKVFRKEKADIILLKYQVEYLVDIFAKYQFDFVW
jgi:hypothetical protein